MTAIRAPAADFSSSDGDENIQMRAERAKAARVGWAAGGSVEMVGLGNTDAREEGSVEDSDGGDTGWMDRHAMR